MYRSALCTSAISQHWVKYYTKIALADLLLIVCILHYVWTVSKDIAIFKPEFKQLKDVYERAFITTLTFKGHCSETSSANDGH